MLTTQEAFRTLGLDGPTKKHTVERAHRALSRRYLPNAATPPAAAPRYRRAQGAFIVLEKSDFPSTDFSYSRRASRDNAPAFTNAGIGAQAVYASRPRPYALADPYDYDTIDLGYLGHTDSETSDSRSSSDSFDSFSGLGISTSYSSLDDVFPHLSLNSCDSSDSDSSDSEPSDAGATPTESGGPRNPSWPRSIIACLLWILICVVLTSLSYFVFGEVQPAGWLCEYASMLQDRLIAGFRDASTTSLMVNGSMPDLRSQGGAYAGQHY